VAPFLFVVVFLGGKKTMLQLTVCPEPECGQVAEITSRQVLESTSGPVEHIGTQCPKKHVFPVMPVYIVEARKS
jgi:hypothetical protein